MNELQLRLLTDLHKSNYRQGPGGDDETMKALLLAGLDKSQNLKIADIGCGTGASTIQLAKKLNAEIFAIDFLKDFLDELKIRAESAGVSEKIETIECSMDALSFADKELDVIWSEGAIYNIGFENGVKLWSPFLKSGGKLIVSEITWLTEKRPLELQNHWDSEYPEIDLASAKIGILEKNGFKLEGYFYLPPVCWIDNYYSPLQNGFQAFLEHSGGISEALEIVEGEKNEIALYEKYQDFFSYGVYIAKKI